MGSLLATEPAQKPWSWLGCPKPYLPPGSHRGACSWGEGEGMQRARYHRRGEGCWLDLHWRKKTQLAWLFSLQVYSYAWPLPRMFPFIGIPSPFPSLFQNSHPALWTSRSLFSFSRSERHQDPILEWGRVVEKGVHHSFIPHVKHLLCQELCWW